MKKIAIAIILVSCIGCIHEPRHGVVVHKEVQSSGPSYGAPLLYEVTIDSMGQKGYIHTTEEQYQKIKIGDTL